MEQQVSQEPQPIIQRLVAGPWATNCYVVACPNTGETMIIDPAADQDLILKTVANYKPKLIALTHGHFDHVGAVRPLKIALSLPVALHQLDAGLAQITPEIELDDGQIINVGDLVVKVLYTPGHTAGSVAFQVGRDVFVGDLIFPGGPGATRTPQDFQRILRSITAKILPLSPDTILNPGHGDGLTVGIARQEVSDFLRKPAKTDLCGDVLWSQD
jgi:glyoxylase-like metal-dependent hydrolase (beta-lactamase superfamily II)